MNNHRVCSLSTWTRFIVDDNDTVSNTIAESDMSLKSGSFLHMVEWSSTKDVGPILKSMLHELATNIL